MHSMLRQNQVRAQDVKPYIRAFTRNNPLDLGEWAKEEGSLFEPGTLIFLLEPAKKPPGMTSFARGQQGSSDVTADAFRVKDMCVVVDKIDGKCWVLAISPSAFELRFIDTLFREKAQKSFLEGIDFNYLSCQPRPGLTPEKLKELRALSSLYSKSGSRRTMAQDDSGPEEPAKAMLAFLGADLGPGAAKQVMELGLICNLIFAPEGEQENRTQSLVKSCFSPILSTDNLKGLTPPPAPSTAKVVQNQELINEEVSLLTQTYLANEAQEAEEYLKYAPPAAQPPDTSQSSGVWTSQPAAPQANSGDQFKPLTPPPTSFGDMGSFTPPSSGAQPSLSLSPDIPSILTGDHPVIAIDQKLAPKESNGQSEDKVPSMPAWYLTTHDVDEMNKVGLRRAAEAPRMPEGLERLESELSYDALPVVDARFRGGEAPPAQEFNPAAAPQTYSEQFSVDMATGEAGLPPTSSNVGSTPASEAPGALPSGVAGGDNVEKDFVDKIFESSGSKGTIEFNAEKPETVDTPKRRARDWQPVAEEPQAPAPNSGFVSPGSLAVPQPPADTPKDANLIERLSGPPEQPVVEEATTPSWADGARSSGVPTNLKDMLTADSAVFSTSSSAKFPEPMPQSEVPPPETPAKEPPTGFNTAGDASPFASPAANPPADQGDTTRSAAEDSTPAPWMNLPHHVPSTEAATDQAAEPSSAVSAGAPTADNYSELTTALSGLMDSSEATEKPPGADSISDDAVSPTYSKSSEFSVPPSVTAAAAEAPKAEGDLFGEVDVIDKVIDLAATPPEPQKAPEPEADYEYYQDNRDMTMDLDAAFLAKMSSGPATLSAPAAPPEEAAHELEPIPATPPETVAGESEIQAATVPSFDTNLVSPAMAAHAQSMAEPLAETSEPVMETDSPSLAANPPASEADSTAASDLTPIRPGRSRYRRGVPPRAIPDSEAEPAAAEPTETTSPAAETPFAVETSASLDQVAEPAAPAKEESIPTAAETAPVSAPVNSDSSTDLFGRPNPAVEPAAEPSASAFSDSGDLLAEVSEPQAQPTTERPDSSPAVSPTSASDAFFPNPEPTVSAVPPQAPVTEDSNPAPVAATPVDREPATASSDIFPATASQDTSPVTPPQAEPPTVSFEDSGVFLSEKDIDEKPAPYGLDLKPLSASGLQRTQPSVEPKLVISESTRFMARLNQRLSEADKKLSSRCDQSRDRLNRELDALLDDARKVERQNELSTGTLTEQLVQHLETVSEEVKAKISKTSSDARDEIQQLIKQAEENVEQMHKDMLKELELTESKFQTETNTMSESTRANLNDHAQTRLTDFNRKLEEITVSLEAAYTHHVNVLMARYGKFETRLNEELDAIINSLDRNVGSMTVEIDGSWDRASEKLTASQSEFGNSVNYLVHSCRADIKQVHLDLYAKQILPRLLENKDIFRSMLLDMKRNFEEQSEKVRKKQLSGLTTSIDDAKTQLNSLTKECLSTIESVGKGQQFGLEDLFKNTNTRLEEIIATVESRLKTAKQQIVDNDEACMKTSESSRVEDEPAFSKEKQQAIAALNECRTKADNALETHISSSCLDLEQLSEQMQEDLAKQRQDWTAQVRTSADESIMQVKQAIQDAFQAIETAKEKHME